MSRYLTVCAVWLAAYFGPVFAGDWYYNAFNLYQCCASLLVLYFVLPFRHAEAWASWLSCFCVIQIIFHAGDYLFDYAHTDYNYLLNVLNLCEAVILFGIGGISKLYRWLKHGRTADRDAGSFRSSISSNQARQV